ncbi:MAG: putative metal-dependent hydrolase [Acidobacteria bacterium]|nr:putative metal-dependent hydrolase [Acidobacteriota bacterium]
MDHLRYPIGGHQTPAAISAEDRERWIGHLEQLPGRLRELTAGLNDAALDTPYRPGGWTVRQVVHHLADSHMNAYLRSKFALTEDNPTIMPYDEVAWAEMADGRALPVEVSLGLLEGLHRRWVTMFRSLTPEQFTRTFFHPANGVTSLEQQLALYCWHSRHHTAHIERAPLPG